MDKRSLSARRAWIEISPACRKKIGRLSLSARRAWIEIIDYVIDYVNDAVALRKESVDRNDGFYWWVEGDSLSLSARRAWIEM